MSARPSGAEMRPKVIPSTLSSWTGPSPDERESSHPECPGDHSECERNPQTKLRCVEICLWSAGCGGPACRQLCPFSPATHPHVTPTPPIDQQTTACHSDGALRASIAEHRALDPRITCGRAHRGREGSSGCWCVDPVRCSHPHRVTLWAQQWHCPSPAYMCVARCRKSCAWARTPKCARTSALCIRGRPPAGCGHRCACAVWIVGPRAGARCAHAAVCTFWIEDVRLHSHTDRPHRCHVPGATSQPAGQAAGREWLPAVLPADKGININPMCPTLLKATKRFSIVCAGGAKAPTHNGSFFVLAMLKQPSPSKNPASQ